MITENGWPSCGPDQLDRSPIPGTDIVVGLQRGQPSIILKAFMADLNWYVESAYNSRGGADEGGWTATNSVPTSNHLGGTAVDYNWDDHPMGNVDAGWGWSEIVGGNEVPRVRELLEWYEGTVFWGNDWNRPKDGMHFQMGYQTFGDPHTQDFINRKILPNGFSRFRDFKEANKPTVNLVDILAEAMLRRDGVDYAGKLAAVQQCLAECDCTNLFRIAMWMAQVGTESGGLQWMEEIASGAEYEGRTDLGNIHPGDGVRYKGRGPIQVTGRHNYTQLSKWAWEQELVPSPTFFVDQPAQLASDAYGFMGVTWYWTTQRPMNDASDAQDVVLATKYVNGGDHGLPDRTNRYQKCIRMGERLLNLITAVGEDDWMAGVDVDRLNRAVDKILGGGTMPTAWESRGMFGLADQPSGGVDDTVGMLLNTDANAWNIVVIIGALLGIPDDVQRIKDTANGDFPEGAYAAEDEWLAERAQQFAQKLLPLCGSLTAEDEPTPPKKASKKTT